MTTYNTPDRPDFIHQQYEVAAHIRNPAQNPCPIAIEERRMNIYRELFYNNVEDFMANAYPVLRSILSDEHWHTIIRDYFANHISHTPFFPEMPREFLKYLEHERTPHPADPPFLLELAHYEWVELALSLADSTISDKEFDPAGDLLSGIPIVSSLAWPLSYSFPVHKISADFQPQQAAAELVHLLVFRDHAFEIHFIEINSITARLLQIITTLPEKTGIAALQQIAVELHHTEPSIVISHGEQLLKDLKLRGIMLGTRVCTPYPSP